MSNKITLQDIIDLLAEKHQMTKKDAETFVRGMFELIEEALATEKYVKVKGLGTFKLTEVGNRGSVDVKTGERFEIQGHTRITFTPDSTMRDLINKPFAHFETVALNENTLLEDTETEIEGEEEEEENTEDVTTEIIEESVIAEKVLTGEVGEVEVAQDEKEIISALEEESIVPAEDTKEVPQTTEPEEELLSALEEEKVIPAPLSEETVPVEEVETGSERDKAAEIEKDIQEETVNVTEIPSVEDSVSPEVETSEETKIVSEEDIISSEVEMPEETRTSIVEENIASSEVDTPEEAKTTSEKDILSSEVDTSEEKDLKNDSSLTAETEIISLPIEEAKKKKTPWRIIAAILLILCIAGGLYWYLQNNDKDPIPQTPPKEATAPQIQTEKEESSIPAPPSDSLTQEKDTTNALPKDLSQKVTTPQGQQTSPTSSAKASGNKDIAKVTLADTVEYDITGTKTNYTLQEGESLIKVALKFYGTKKLWPYIVKHNKGIIKNADRVPIGTTLRIPELVPKKQ